MPATPFSLSMTMQNFKKIKEGRCNNMANAFKKRSRKLNVGRKLPPSYHTLPGEEFDVKKSEVVQWLIDQPEILNFLWDQFKQSGDVVYDPETNVWTGVDYDGH